MKSYTLAAFTSAIIGWIIASAAFYPCSLVAFGDVDEEIASAVCIYSLLFALVANLLFVQLPKFYIEKAFLSFSRLSFSLLFAVYAFVIFVLPTGWLITSYIHPKFSIMLFVNAVINGFAFGFSFYSIWKPTYQAA